MINYKQSDIFSCPHFKSLPKVRKAKSWKGKQGHATSPSTHHQAKSLKIQAWIKVISYNVILLSLAFPSLEYYKIYKTTGLRVTNKILFKIIFSSVDNPQNPRSFLSINEKLAKAPSQQTHRISLSIKVDAMKQSARSWGNSLQDNQH